MRLMDSVSSNLNEPTRIMHGSRLFEIAGSSSFGPAIRSCPLRYVLDDNVTAACLQLLETDRGMLDPANGLLRVPAEQFWIEWVEDRAPPGAASHHRRRAGILVNAAVDGRSGTIHSFWMNDDGTSDLAQIYIEFDLDAPLSIDGDTSFRGRHVELHEFQPMLDCVVFRTEPAWASYFSALARHELQQTQRQCANAGWFDLAFVFAFSAIITSKAGLESRNSDLAKLNKARAKQGKSALLDHVEARLCIDVRSDDAAPAMSDTRARSAPRLHQVRGHLVRGANFTYWRTTHLRGDPLTTLLHRNVRVTRGSQNYAER